MPLSGREFAEVVKNHCSDGAGEMVLKSAERIWPRDSDEAAQKRAWISSLPPEGREMLQQILQDASEYAVAAVLCVLDGVGGSYVGTFELYAVDPDESRHLVNREDQLMLHDEYSELIHGE